MNSSSRRTFSQSTSRNLYEDTPNVPLTYSSTAEDENEDENNGKIIDLSSQYLTHIPDNLFSNGSKYSWLDITELNLSNNRLTQLSKELFKLSNLQVFDVSNNNLVSLPVEIGNLKMLKAFAARNNQLQNIPKQFQLLNQIGELNLAGNKLSEFPLEFLNMVNLQTLYLGANELTSLPNNIDKLTNLEIFYLGGNQLNNVPDTLGNLKNLTYLALCDNQLETLPSSFGKLTKLRTLSLHNNQIKVLPTEIVTLQNLSNLSLRNNPLVTRFVNDVQINPPTLKELAARVVRISLDEYTYMDKVPPILKKYLQSATTCENPKCKGVYFEAKAEHVKFSDFCGKFRIPLLQYLCSPHCTTSDPAVAISSESETDEEIQPSSSRMRRVLLG